MTESHPESRISPKEEKRATTRRRTVVVVVERERDGQRGGFCVDDKTRPTKSGVPLVLRFFGKDNDVNEEGATSTLYISNWKFVVYSESFVRSLSLSQRREILLLFARKGRDADLKSLLHSRARRRAAVDRRGEDAARRAKRIEQQYEQQGEQQDHLGATSPIGQERFSGTRERILIIQRKTRV